VNVKAQARSEFGTLEENEIAFTMKIEAVSAPGLEMGIAFDASFAYRRRACRRRRFAASARFEDASWIAAAGTIVGSRDALQNSLDRVYAALFILDGENNLCVVSFVIVHSYGDTGTLLNIITTLETNIIGGSNVTEIFE
jgi:hypothetical protein